MSKRQTALLGLASLATAAVTVTAGILPATRAIAGPTLNGAGATFPASIYERWFAQYADKTGTKVNYQSVGSGAGIKQFIAGTVDFGASDAPMSEAEIAKVSRGVQQLPMTSGAIAVAYNQPGCDLKLTQKQLADIFLGKIKNYSQVGCKAGPINVVRRSDGSGTTYNFTNSLAAFSPEWKKEVGVAKSVQWPTGIGAKGNEGVSETIKRTKGGLGYIELSYAKEQNLVTAAIQNRAGQFVKPTAESAAAALAEIDLGADLVESDPNPAGKGSYPIVSYTWILAYKTGSGTKAIDLRKLFDYMISPAAQSQAPSIGYVAIPAKVQKQVKAAIRNIK